MVSQRGWGQNLNKLQLLEKEADSLYYDVNSVRHIESYHDEVALRTQVLALYKDTISNSYKQSLAKKYASEALLETEKGNYKTAIAISNTSIKIMEAMEKPDFVFMGQVYRMLYHQHAYSGDWESAYSLTKKTRQILMDTLVPNHKRVADVEFDIGFVAQFLGDISTELKQYQIAIDKYISFQGKYNYDVANKYLNLANLYGSIGYLKKELHSYLEAIDILEAIDYKDKSYLSIAYGNVSKWYEIQGDYEKAEQYRIKKESLIKKFKKPGAPWYNETYLGRTYVENMRQKADILLLKGNTIEALKLNEQIFKFLEGIDTNDPKNNPNRVTKEEVENWVAFAKIVTLRYEARILANSDPDKAKALYEKAMSIKAGGHYRERALEDVLFLADYYTERHKYHLATDILKTGMQDIIEENDDYGQMQLYAKQAKIECKQGDFTKMDSTYQNIFHRLRKDSNSNLSLVELRYQDCKPYGNLIITQLIVNAAANYIKAFEVEPKSNYLEIARNLSLLANDMFAVNNQDLKYNDTLYALISKINQQLLETALLEKNTSHLPVVFEHMEMAKSQTLWKAFLNSTQRKYLDIPENIIDKEDELRAELHFYKKLSFTNKEKDSSKLKLWKSKILDIEQSIDTIVTSYQKTYPTYYNLAKKPFNLQDIQKQLKEKQLVIQYVFAHTDVFAFTISNTKIDLFRIGKKEKLTHIAESFIGALQLQNTTAYKSYSQDMYQLLIPSELALNDTEDILFILDDILFYVPMEVIANANNTYLMENFAVGYTSSLTLWNEQLKKKEHRNNELAIFTPEYNLNNNPKSEQIYLENIKGAKDEAIKILDFFDGDLYQGEHASKDQFLKIAKDYNILHLAMHGNLNNVNAEFSSLDFSASNANDKLYISELYGQSINANLVVLSACNTGVGKLKKGYGPVNISRAFTYAGVPSTVMSLWKVPDKETSQLMTNFYKHLKKGEPKNLALKNAKLDYLENTEDELLKHPYYWAGFIVSGDTSPIVNSNDVWIWIGAVFLLLIFLLAFRKPLFKRV
ncbi:hypothetical protein MHTCC0001_30570 [Flavobacteriaceae bacterium MHTCC 0001]